MATDNNDKHPPWERPNEHLIADAYQYLFASPVTRDRLRENAINGTLLPQKYEFGEYGLAGRSLAWKTFLTPVPPLTPVLSQGLASPLDEIRRRRQDYVDVLKELMRAPDGNYVEGFILPGQSRPPTPVPKKGEFERNNPLSLDEENPWKQWFEHMDLRKTILQDVQRTFPDLSYFRESQVQSDLANILYLHTAKHSDIGYRQGMHELLASIFLAVDYDSLDRWTSGIQDKDILEMCDRTWVAADAWYLFGIVMKHVNPWYEWRESPSKGLQNSTEGLQPYSAPIVTICDRIQNHHLKNVDPTLWRRMNEVGIEPQLFGIRWLRLLFTREFNFKDSMLLWDGLFAVDPTLQLAQWVCVAMLVRIRNKLIPADYSEQLAYLLRYPGLPEVGSLHVSLLLQQAIRLNQDPTTPTGASLVLQNQNVLNLPIETPEPPVRGVRRRGDRNPAPPRTPVDRREGVSSPVGGFPEIARNLLDRSESLGINRAIFNTVSEIRRNITEIPSAFQRTYSNSSTSLPTLGTWQNDSSPESELPPAWEPPSKLEVEGELKALKLQQKALSRAMAWAVDSLLVQDSDLSDPRKREAFECLSYVRDVLAVGQVTNLDLKALTRQHGPPITQIDNRVATPEIENQTEEAEKAPQTPSKDDGSFPMLLSRREFKPASSLSRTPYLSREPTPSHTPPNTTMHRPSASYAAPSSTTRTEYFASSAPASATTTRFATSPVTSSNPRFSAMFGQRNTPPNNPSSPAIDKPQAPVQKPVPSGKEPASPWSPTSTAQQHPSTNYPPPRASEDRTQQKPAPATTIVDPLGVLR